MSAIDRDEEIQKFLQGDLSGEELKQFEQKLAKDPDLAAEVRDYERLVEGLEAVGLDHFKTEVSSWEALQRDEDMKELEEITSRRVVSITRYIPIAATVALLLFAGIYFYLSRSPGLHTLYTEYYVPYPDMLTDRGDSAVNPSAKSLLFAGIEAYNSKNFEVAIENLQAYIAVEPDHKGVALYLAISQMELNQFEAATKNFSTARQDPVFKQQAEWYEALLNLKARQPDKSQLILKIIADNPNHYRHQEAARLLNSLD